MAIPVVLDVSSGPAAAASGRALANEVAGDEQESLRAGVQEVLQALSQDVFPNAAARDLAEQFVRELHSLVDGRAVVVRLGAEASESGQRDATLLFLDRALRVVAEVESNRQEAAITKLAEVILPDPLADARGPLAVDNLALRDRFVTETGPLTSIEIAAQAGYRGKNPYATAARWKKAGEVFSVHHRGVEYFPAFQFQDGRPHPTVRRVLDVLPGTMSPWQQAFWFVSTNGWLNDRAPVDVLDDVEAVLTAARRETEEVGG